MIQDPARFGQGAALSAILVGGKNLRGPDIGGGPPASLKGARENLWAERPFAFAKIISLQNPIDQAFEPFFLASSSAFRVNPCTWLKI